MLPFVPLLTYLAAVVAVAFVMRALGAMRSHIVFWLFVAYSAPYALRFALQSALAFPWSSLDLLNPGEFLTTTIVLSALLVATAVVYRIAYRWSLAGRRRDSVRALQWIDFTERWGSLVYRYLSLVAVGCIALGLFVRFVVQGDRYVLAFAADLESRQASMGWGFVNFILSQISVAIILIALELRRPRREVALLFIVLVTLALLSGSKGGFLVPLVYILAFAFHRRRLKLSLYRAAAIGAIGLISLIVGVGLRGWIESGVLDVSYALSPVGVLAPALGRFFAMDITQIMMVRPSTYMGITADFRAYSLGAVIPGALWPSKPLNPCLLLADGVGFPLVSCVAPGWAGGFMVLAGPLGLILAPLVVGIVMARIAWRSSTLPENVSLRQPLAFSIALLWLGIVNEGTYYQLVPIFLPVLLTLVLVYLGIMILNGRIGRLPLFPTVARIPRAGE
jgi:hypothetical protein